MEQLRTYFGQLASEFFGDPTVHPIFRRALALGIDWVLLMVAIFLLYYFVDPDWANNTFLQLLLFLSYFGLLNSHMGRTIGKLTMDLYVVNPAGDRIEIWRAMIRALPLTILLHIPGLMVAAVKSSTGVFYIVVFVGVSLLVGFALLPVLSSTRLTLADLVTGTRVVSSDYLHVPFSREAKDAWKIYLVGVVVALVLALMMFGVSGLLTS